MLMKKGGFVRLSPGKGMIIDGSIPLALWRVPWLGDESLGNMCRAVSLIRYDWGGVTRVTGGGEGKAVSPCAPTDGCTGFGRSRTRSGPRYIEKAWVTPKKF